MKPTAHGNKVKRWRQLYEVIENDTVVVRKDNKLKLVCVERVFTELLPLHYDNGHRNYSETDKAVVKKMSSHVTQNFCNIPVWVVNFFIKSCPGCNIGMSRGMVNRLQEKLAQKDSMELSKEPINKCGPTDSASPESQHLREIYARTKCQLNHLSPDNTSSGVGCLSRSSFEIIKKVGAGTFGEVFVAHRSGKITEKIALKIIVKKNYPLDFKKEILTQNCLPYHPNILELYTYFADRECIYFVLEYAPHDSLFDMKRPFTLETSAKYISDVCSGLRHCHLHNVIHRDVKLENLMLGNDLKLKIIDFGLATFNIDHNYSVCGAIDYRPPEMINKEKYDHRVDIWPIGVLLFEFLANVAPFEAENDFETEKRILDLNISWEGKIISVLDIDRWLMFI
jgi:hypothetical protein